MNISNNNNNNEYRIRGKAVRIKNYIPECNKLAEKEYKIRPSKVGTATDSDNKKILQNIGIQTHSHHQGTRPDLLVVNIENESVEHGIVLPVIDGSFETVPKILDARLYELGESFNNLQLFIFQ